MSKPDVSEQAELIVNKECEPPPTPSQKVMSKPDVSEQSKLIINKECDPPPTPSQKVMSDTQCCNESRDKPPPSVNHMGNSNHVVVVVEKKSGNVSPTMDLQAMSTLCTQPESTDTCKKGCPSPRSQESGRS